MPNETATNPWWGWPDTPGGHQFREGQDVILLPRKKHTGTSQQAQRRDTRNYTELVVETMKELWPVHGETVWYAPEAHGTDRGGPAWHWDRLHLPTDEQEGSVWLDTDVPVHNRFRFLEATYFRGTPEELNAIVYYRSSGRGQGQGWQWPLLIVFDQSEPTTAHKVIMMRGRVPWVVLGDEEEEEPMPTPDAVEPEEDDVIELPPYPSPNTGYAGGSTRKRLIRLEAKIDYLMSVLLLAMGADIGGGEET